MKNDYHINPGSYGTVWSIELHHYLAEKGFSDDFVVCHDHNGATYRVLFAHETTKLFLPLTIRRSDFILIESSSRHVHASTSRLTALLCVFEGWEDRYADYEAKDFTKFESVKRRMKKDNAPCESSSVMSSLASYLKAMLATNNS